MGAPTGLFLFEQDLIGLPALPPGLEVLDLNRNPRLRRLPDAIAGLAHLRFLYAEDTGLTALPALPGSLVYLNVAGNRLRELPLDGLARLRDLRAQGNPLDPLPDDAFAETTDLRALELARTGLTELPASLTTLARLRTLGLRGNALTHLPDDLSGLTALRELDLRGNRLTDVPASLGALPGLERVDLRWNPLPAGVPAALARLDAEGGVLWHPGAG